MIIADICKKKQPTNKETVELFFYSIHKAILYKSSRHQQTAGKPGEIRNRPRYQKLLLYFLIKPTSVCRVIDTCIQIPNESRVGFLVLAKKPSSSSKKREKERRR